MPAFQMYLDQTLEEAVLAGALSLQEAWLMQDQYLLSMGEVVEIPEELWPLVQRLSLLEAAHLPMQ
jgi:hypothetical protein